MNNPTKIKKVLWIGKQCVISGVGLVNPGDEITLTEEQADKFINGGLADTLHELADELEKVEPKKLERKTKGV